MKRIRISIILLVLILSKSIAFSNDTLTLKSFLDVIQTNYPLIKKADLYNEFTNAYKLSGEGTFDPKINSNYEVKNFDNVDYFSVWRSEVKLPTRLPVDLSLGYENNDGSFLNAENSVPNNGLVYGTLNLSLFRGLMFDEQRYRLQSFELKGSKSQIEKDILIREIIVQAINTYLDWSSAFYKVAIFEDYYNAINERHQYVKQLFLNGDKPAIDTIESRINLNTALKIYLESTKDLNSKRLKLSLFVWDENGIPLTINNSVLPETLDGLVDQIKQLSDITNPIFSNDPSIRKIDNQIQHIELKNRLEKEQLKPQIDIKYNTIVNLGKEEFNPAFNINDYKYGLNVEIPLRNRKSKGNIRLNKALINQANLDKSHYHQTLWNKYRNLELNIKVQEDVLEVINEKINNSLLLNEAENIKFDLGESSVFLLNQRERKLLDAKTELIKGYLNLGTIYSELYFLKLGQ